MPPKSSSLSKEAAAKKRQIEQYAYSLRMIATQEAAKKISSIEERRDFLRFRLAVLGQENFKMKQRLDKYLKFYETKLSDLEYDYEHQLSELNEAIHDCAKLIEQAMQKLAEEKSMKMPTEEEIKREIERKNEKYLKELEQDEIQNSIEECKFDEERRAKLLDLENRLNTLYADANMVWINYVKETIEFHRVNNYYPNDNIVEVSGKFGIKYFRDRDYLRGCPEELIGIGQSRFGPGKGAIGYILEKYRIGEKIIEYEKMKDIESQRILTEIKMVSDSKFQPVFRRKPISKLEEKRYYINHGIELWERNIQKFSQTMEKMKTEYEEIMSKFETKKKKILNEREILIADFEHKQAEWVEMKRQLAELS